MTTQAEIHASQMEAFSQAAAQDADPGTEQPAPEASPSPEPGVATEGEAPQPTTPPQPPQQPTAADASGESFTDFDPSQLEGEISRDALVAMHRNMNRAFTQRMQETAEWRRLGELGVDPQAARQAIEFAGQLQSDPSYARQVYDALAQAYGFAGGQPAPAAQPAAGDEFGLGFDDPASAGVEQRQTQGPDIPQDHPLMQRLAQLEQRIAEQDETSFLTSFAQEIKQAELAVRETHADWGDADIARVYELAPSYDGDLTKAAAAYEQWQGDVIGRYLTRKAGPGGGPSPVPSGGSGEMPPEPAQNLRQASDRAEESIRQVLGAQ